MHEPAIRQEGNVYIFCEESKIGNWIVSHIFLSVTCFLILFFLLTVFSKGVSILCRLWWIVLLFFGQAVLFRILWRNMCSRVEIDTIAEKIKFFRFYKETVEAPVRSVKFRFTWMFTCFYAGEKFIIPGGYINAIAEVLPAGVEIEFGKSFWGQRAKKQFQKRQNPVAQYQKTDKNRE